MNVFDTLDQSNCASVCVEVLIAMLLVSSFVSIVEVFIDFLCALTIEQLGNKRLKTNSGLGIW